MTLVYTFGSLTKNVVITAPAGFPTATLVRIVDTSTGIGLSITWV